MTNDLETTMSKRIHTSRSWDPVADWYIGWVGAEGSEHHRKLAIPAALELLGDVQGQHILDIGCGTAALARHVIRRGARYTGVDTSRRLLSFARRHNRRACTFLHADATRLPAAQGPGAGAFDAAVFLLSIQDIEPLAAAVAGAAWAVRPGGRVVILMTHPCFRVPRQSGWGWDASRRLQYRRVDRYLTPLAVPMKTYGDRGHRSATRSHHRPLETYFNVLSDHGLHVCAVRELAAPEDPVGRARRPEERRANAEIPLFLGIAAVKASDV